MQHPGLTASPPAHYRIALAVSLALLVHTLVLSALPLLFERTERVASTLSFELIAPGSVPTAKTTASTEGQKDVAPVRHPDFDVTPHQSKTPVVNTTREDPPEARRPAEQEAPASPPATSVAPTPSSERATASAASTPVAAGAPAETRFDATPAEITRITQAPEETDAYIVRLATRIAGELKRSRIRAVRALSQPVGMEIELQLLKSGALTQARVARSSGVAEIDAAAYRAALAASPYPELPEDEERKRFRVELVFSPERTDRP